MMSKYDAILIESCFGCNKVLTTFDQLAFFRKIASIIVFLASGFDADLIGDLLEGLDQDCVQRAFQKTACEHIPLQFQHHFDTQPGECLWAADAINAFNISQKLRALFETAQKTPAAFPLLRLMYLGDSTGFLLGMEGGIQEVLSREGFHQGDVLGTWGFAMSIQPLLRALRQHLADNGFWNVSLIRFFVDDGNFAAPPEAMLLIMKFLFEHGPEYGYHVSNVKGVASFLADKLITRLPSIGEIDLLKLGSRKHSFSCIQQILQR